MPLDLTDKKLVKGMIWFAVLGAAAYLMPWYGYQAQVVEENHARDELLETKKKYDRYHTPMHPAIFGTASDEGVPAPDGRLISEIQSDYQADNVTTQSAIGAVEQISRMNFPEWTQVPETQREPGVYFAKTYEKKRFDLENEWRMAKVECLDATIGFDLKGIEVQFDKNKAEEYLRELHIAESIIRLCIKAKLREESDQKSRGLRPEAFMKIIKVRPQPSVPTGPSALIANPKYSKDEKNPLSERFRKYNVFFWKNFIQEYPVEIMLQCDYNTFERFLHSVRSPGQFLVIRSLEILSPFAMESQADKTEISGMLSQIGAEGANARTQMPREEQILLRISAAGMDFFDPEKFPDGFYKTAKEEKKATPRRRRMRSGS